jgi:hypothetical protein
VLYQLQEGLGVGPASQILAPKKLGCSAQISSYANKKFAGFQALTFVDNFKFQGLKYLEDKIMNV